MTRLPILSVGNLSEEHCCTNEWTSGQKPYLTKNDRRTLHKTANFVPVVGPGLASSSSAVSSFTSFSKDSPKKTEMELRTQNEQGETACEASQSDWRSSKRTSKIQKCQHSHTLPMTLIRNVPQISIQEAKYLHSFPQR